MRFMLVMLGNCDVRALLKSDMYDGVLTLLSASHKLPQRLSKPVAHDHTVVHENISHQVGNTVVAECHELGDRGR
jgi:hypothetical protein